MTHKALQTHRIATHRDAVPVALVCSLGGKSQIVTFTLDALLRAGVLVSRVVVIHFVSEDGELAAVEQLQREFSQHAPYVEQEISLRAVPIQKTLSLSDNGRNPVLGPKVTGSTAADAAEAVWETAARELNALKREGIVVHLCVSGGPRLLGTQMLSAAAIMLGISDSCWLLNTDVDVREEAGHGALMHAPEHTTRLINAPMLPLGQLEPGLRHVFNQSGAMSMGRRRLDGENLNHCRAVLKALGPGAPRHALAALVRAPHFEANLDNIARRLNISKKTLRTHLSVAKDLVRNEWGVHARDIEFHVLRELFQVVPDSDWDQLDTS
jgi:CRISPR-associated protein NE0113 (Cas_NE0113)